MWWGKIKHVVCHWVVDTCPRTQVGLSNCDQHGEETGGKTHYDHDLVEYHTEIQVTVGVVWWLWLSKMTHAHPIHTTGGVVALSSSYRKTGQVLVVVLHVVTLMEVTRAQPRWVAGVVEMVTWQHGKGEVRKRFAYTHMRRVEWHGMMWWCIS